ncbi:DUF559 domain-containing protein [Naasia lichenicola]|uniref:DUF559 domain-containing protein n=1 Tax=Naasia lichenicola TaxID=2565933 RepID=A0A4S4FLP7_9MICO|nr:DUF559 domain-containing protein [Naasia lichenicola]
MVRAAAELGASRSRLRAKDLAAPHRGVRVIAAPKTTLERARAYEPLLRGDQFFSHTTAAALFRMRMPRGFQEDVLHVTSVKPQRAPRVEGIVGHRADSVPTIVSSGSMRVSAPIDTWIALGATLPIGELIVMGDGLLARKSPRATLDQLTRAVDAVAGQRGASRLRSALTELRPGTDSAQETILRLVLMRAGLGEPEVNGVIQTRSGPFHGDLVYRSARVVVEYDGEQHRTDDRQFAIDVDRLDIIMAAGWRVIRVDKRLLARPGKLIARVREALGDVS